MTHILFCAGGCSLDDAVLCGASSSSLGGAPFSGGGCGGGDGGAYSDGTHFCLALVTLLSVVAT
jgi:hypothetical protein